MARVGVDRPQDWLRCAVSQSIQWNRDGSAELLKDCLWPNQYLLDIADNGEPEDHSIRDALPERIVAHHINVSRPGKPLRSEMTRQTTSPIPVEESGGWEMEGPWVAGRPAEAKSPFGTDDRKPAPPVVETAPSSGRGFTAGTYGYAYGFGTGPRNLTTITAFRYFTLATNQIPKIPVPEGFPVGNEIWFIVLTRVNGGPQTARINRRVRTDTLRGKSEYPLRGPWRDLGKAPQSNQSAFGTVNRPDVGRDVRIVQAPRDLRAGRYRLFVQLKNERGVSLLSRASEQINVRGDRIEREIDGQTQVFDGPVKKNSGIFCRIPKAAKKRGVEYTYWLQYEPPQGGTITFLRAYRKKSKFGTAHYFQGTPEAGAEAERGGLILYNYPPEEEPRGLRVGLAQEEPPVEDTSVLEAPDLSGAPDDPVIAGTEIAPPGRYLVSVTGVLESGALTKTSEPAEITTGTGQIISARPRAPGALNLLPSAEFARVDSGGEPKGWTFTNTASGEPGAYSVSGGILTLRTLQPTASEIRAESALIPATAESILTVGGTLEAQNHASGEILLYLKQLSALGVLLASWNVGTLSANGLRPFLETFSPRTLSLHPETASVRLGISIRPDASGSVNLRGLISNLRVLALPTDIRKVKLASPGSGEPDDFGPDPATPLYGGSFAAYGLPPSVLGEPREAEPPAALLDCEGTPVIPDDWTKPATTSVTQSTETTSPIHDAASWKISDQASTGVSVAYALKDFTGLSGKQIALRFLVRGDQRPTHGTISLGFVGRPSQSLVQVRLRSDGVLLAYVYVAGQNRYVEKGLINGVTSGTLLDVEIFVRGGGTSNGGASVSVGRDGESRSVMYEDGGFDYRSYTDIHRVLFGVHTATESRSKWTLTYDQIVVTEDGDILSRENPPPPANYTPPPPDRPQLAVDAGGNQLYREYDEDGESIRQTCVLIAPGEGPSVVPFLAEPIAVKPGMGYTASLYARWHLFADQRPSELRVYLEGDSVERILAATLSMSGEGAWQELSSTFEIPDTLTDTDPVYTQARVELELQDGDYVLQEPLLAQGIYITQAERDAKRGYGRAASGEVSAVLPADPPASSAGLSLGRLWSDFGIRQATDEATIEEVPNPSVTLERYYSSSDDGISFTSEVTEPSLLVPDKRFLRTRAVLSGDGRYSPIIPSGGIFLSTWSPLGVLLREDGTHFPGGAIVGNTLYALDYPDTEVDRVGGHHMTVEVSEDIGRIYGLWVVVPTEDAAREIEEASLRGEFVIEVPTAGNSVAGMRYVARFREQARFETQDIPPRILEEFGLSYRVLYGVAEVEESEILESSPLTRPLSWSAVGGLA